MILNPRYYSATKTIREIVSLLPPKGSRSQSFRTKSSFSDIVTAYDIKLETAIRERIGADYPQDSIVGEELGSDAEGEYCWYVDPIDGTTNFVNQSRNYAVSIACYENARPLFGLVYDVERDELYSAYRGEGAFLNGRKLRCTARDDISSMILSVSIINDTFLGESPLCSGFRKLSSDVRAVRSLGCVSLEMCSVASGISDIFVAMKSGPWDYAAARIILEEAGGIVTDEKGENKKNDGGIAVAFSSPSLRDEVFGRYLK